MMGDVTTENSPGEAALWQLFERLALYSETIHHPEVHTVEEALPYWSKLTAQQTKNLFLKDAKGELWLIVLPSERRGDLKGFAAALGAKKFSFASAELLESVLGVRQGAVSPLALVNDLENKVRLALDASLLEGPRLRDAGTRCLNGRRLHSATEAAMAAASLSPLPRPPDVCSAGSSRQPRPGGGVASAGQAGRGRGPLSRRAGGGTGQSRCAASPGRDPAAAAGFRGGCRVDRPVRGAPPGRSGGAG
jgi:Ala-tRNA(Pro) deacylase